jgi:septal ring factor EnvC (AmiA/AmiB activator)
MSIPAMTNETDTATFTITRHSRRGSELIAHGSLPDCMEHIPDSRVVRQKLQIINDAAVVERRLRTEKAKLAEREADLATREEDVAMFREELLQDFVSKLDTLAARIDAMEQERAKDPDDDELPSPPGSQDDGDLQALVPPPAEHRADVPLQYPNVPTSYVHAEDDEPSNLLPPGMNA